MHRTDLLAYLYNHRTRFMEEAAYTRRAIDFIQQQQDCFYRELWPMHVTGSTWVVCPGREKVLLLHHLKLDQWFQPGGHADGDHDILNVALKELSEETGLQASQIRLLSEDVFDVDIHGIPAMHGDPAHEHIDIRFLVEIDDQIEIPGNDESHEVRWVTLEQASHFNNNMSTRRMVQKTRWLHTQLSRR